MADIQLRFHKDMLVMSAPIDYTLTRQGVDLDNDAEFVSLFEGDTVHDALSMEQLAGAACLVSNTEGICKARLAHKRMELHAQEIADSAIEAAQECTPQHIVFEIGPCGLPLDPESGASRKQSRKQYADAASLVAGAEIDGVFLNGMRTAADMQCAIAGVRDATDMPLFASVTLDADGFFDGMPAHEAVSCMEGADVVGVRTAADADAIAAIVAKMAQETDKPILVQVEIKQATEAEKHRATLGPLPDNPYPTPDHLAQAAVQYFKAGAQFLRAVGEATPAYTGALAAVCYGLDARR
ncbi:homocysteine S-methyltransferase family protein [Slackia heliotrinireducens]|uniref:homocysteine S-methyltransferase family protein n=1 Tax=Slackia heliotrinireducens TaxID=84110 RepID=UPI0033164187